MAGVTFWGTQSTNCDGGKEEKKEKEDLLSSYNELQKRRKKKNNHIKREGKERGRVPVS